MTESFSYKTLLNALYSFLAHVGQLVIGIIFTPIIIHWVGLANYGIFVSVNVVTGFFSLLNLGAAYPLIKELSAQDGNKNPEHVNKVFGTIAKIFLLIGCFGLLLALAIGLWGGHIETFRHLPRQTVFILFAAAGVGFFFNSLTSPFNSALYGLQRYDIFSKIYVFSLILINLCTLIVLALGFGIMGMVAVQTAGYIGQWAVYWYFTKKLIPNLRYRYRIDWPTFRPLFAYGFAGYLNDIATTFLLYFDKLTIGATLGPAAVSFYSLSGSVAQKSQNITQSLTSVLFPLSASLMSQGRKQELAIIYRRAVRVITLCAAAMTAGMMLFSYQILYFWVGKEVADHATVSLLWLAGTYFLLSVYSPASNLLMGLGQTKFLAACSGTFAVLNIGFLFGLLPRYGIGGAAAAYCIGVLPIAYVIYYFETHYLDLRDGLLFYGKLIGKIGLVTAIFYLSGHFLLVPLVTKLYWLLVIGPLSVVWFLILYKVLGFLDQEDWLLMTQFLKSKLLKF